ncbi:hypothetical protein HQQ80_00090 [Microbacteriaceae bacterium VKM Ac-2855]|nr:hypothetical protein [Microbacteriaceae bacterium VKM Ac-2855]
MFGVILRRSIVVIVASVVLAGCSPNQPVDGDGEGPADIDISEYAEVHATLDADAGTMRFPIDAYFVDEDGIDRISAANNILLDECMKSSGRSYPPASFDFSVEAREGEGRYGIWSAVEAAQYGYAGRPDTHIVGDAAVAAIQALIDSDPGWDPAFLECSATADRLPSPGKGFIDEDVIELISLPTTIAGDARLLASKSSVWDAERSEWLDCLTANGLTLRTDGPEPWGPDVPDDPEEAIRTAIIDVQCKTDTGLVEALSSLEAQYQAALIDQNRAALDETAKREQTVVDRADEILARHGS